MEQLIKVTKGSISLEGMLSIPSEAKGIVLFAHGSGSSRFSPRNNFVARVLQKGGFGTLLIDLLSQEEDENYQTRFDIGLLSNRLMMVHDWLLKNDSTSKLSLGLFGSSTGAAAALQVASSLKEKVKAVVSRGGRPDLALPYLSHVTAPTLLIVGANDFGVIELNQKAFDMLICHKELTIVPNATHLFEEPGCLEQVAQLATEWFGKFLN